MNILAFDIETVPDVAGGRQLYDLEGLSDTDVARVMFNKRREKTGNEFLPVHLQRVVAISAVYRNSVNDTFKVWTLGDENASEKEILTRFFDGVERFSPTLVTWNGGGFDLPVVQQRGLIHSVPAARYWDMGDNDRDFKWNNYIGRFHFRHTDLMDVLAGYQNRAFAPLDEMAVLMGFPGKMGMSGAAVWDTFLAGDVKAIRDYCETDALNTYLIYLRWLHVKDVLNATRLQQEFDVVRGALSAGAPHLQEFLRIWGERNSDSSQP